MFLGLVSMEMVHIQLQSLHGAMQLKTIKRLDQTVTERNLEICVMLAMLYKQIF